MNITSSASPSDALNIVSFNPRGFEVSGRHDTRTAPRDPAYDALFALNQARWLQKIADNPQSFNGHRAVLTSHETTGHKLHLNTQYRTYADGRALKDTLQEALGASSSNVLQAVHPQPNTEWSWGFSLLVFVMLPGGGVLANQRSLSMLASPGAWSSGFTEIIEPQDIQPDGMQELLTRLISEELPCLQGLGVAKFVGLGVRPASYTWQLLAVLDLRTVPGVKHALSALTPDQETAAWGVVPREGLTLVPDAYPCNLEVRPRDPELTALEPYLCRV